MCQLWVLLVGLNHQHHEHVPPCHEYTQPENMSIDIQITQLFASSGMMELVSCTSNLCVQSLPYEKHNLLDVTKCKSFLLSTILFLYTEGKPLSKCEDGILSGMAIMMILSRLSVFPLR